ncbi:hypothetical protein ZWY2020_027450 [Hordeum vulgare]|nr:hypothetical protein ZWY2020_027450 [Hordeum vulgare]
MSLPLPSPSPSVVARGRGRCSSPARQLDWTDEDEEVGGAHSPSHSDGEGRVELPISVAPRLLGSFLAAARPVTRSAGKAPSRSCATVKPRRHFPLTCHPGYPPWWPPGLGRAPPGQALVVCCPTRWRRRRRSRPPGTLAGGRLRRVGRLPGHGPLAPPLGRGRGAPSLPQGGAGHHALLQSALWNRLLGDRVSVRRLLCPCPILPCSLRFERWPLARLLWASPLPPPTQLGLGTFPCCADSQGPGLCSLSPALAPSSCRSGDGQPRPKRASPADQQPRPAPSARGHTLDEGLGGGSSRSGRGGSDRAGRSPEYYAGTSLPRPPPPRDPERDLAAGLAGTSAGKRGEPPDIGREVALRAELVARPPPAPRSREEHVPREPPARPPAPRSSAPTWRRERPDPRREERRGGPPPRHGAEVRRPDWRPSRAEGADWRREDGPSRRASLVIPPVAPSVAPPLGKKKKSKKKRAGATLHGEIAWPTGAPEQETPELPARVNRQRSCEDTMCINCGCAGHYRSECEPPPPPRAPRCPMPLAYLGYGTERGSFYFVDSEIEEEVVRPHLATVTLAPEQVTPAGLVISADLIRDELATYIGDFRDSSFAWELMISVKAAAAEPDPVPPLEKVWVLVYGLPRGGSAAPRGEKLTHILKAISEPVGKLITADLASFDDDGPTRIEILCPAPAEIDGLSLVFYFDSKGRRLTFELESPVPMDPSGVDPDDPAHEDGGLEDEGGSSEEGSSSKGDVDAGGAPPESSGAGRLPATSVAGPAGHAGGTPVVASVPLSAADTGCPLPLAAVPADATEEEVSVGLEVCHASSPRSPGVVYYSPSPGSPPPPASCLGVPDQGPPPIADPGWLEVSPLAPRARPRESPSPMVVARQSARISQFRVLQDGRIPTIPELAARAAVPATCSCTPSPASF